MSDLKTTLSRMVAPSHKRPGIWRNGIIQIMVTRACDLACNHCTQGSNLAGKPAMMSPDQFETACLSLADYFGVVGMFGGNPAIHPRFEMLCEIMRRHIPFERRGLWCNNLRGKGAAARITFNPRHSNLNVHMSQEAHDEFVKDWPESIPYLKGLTEDSIHGAPFVALKDMIADESTRNDLIADCDINRYWSAAIGVVRGELKAYFCELAYAQAALHAENQDWDGTGKPMPDTGVNVTPGWWRRPMQDFAEQVRTHCHNCGIPMRRTGVQAVGGDRDEFSATHKAIARHKIPGNTMNLVTIDTLPRPSRPSTEYLPGTTPQITRTN